VATGERFVATDRTTRRVSISFSPDKQRERGLSGDVT
jgi:hypothetical protein